MIRKFQLNVQICENIFSTLFLWTATNPYKETSDAKPNDLGFEKMMKIQCDKNEYTDYLIKNVYLKNLTNNKVTFIRPTPSKSSSNTASSVLNRSSCS